ncbi:MAG TPA: hypothetical protein VFH85_07685 [Gammaproteobacteria bacterium]|nr:hypothetical protein [Gammaproteobacteria bacterium]
MRVSDDGLWLGDGRLRSLAVASPQDIEDMRRETVRDAERMIRLLNAMTPPRDERNWRRAQPYRRLRQYFGRVEQLARDGRIG